MPLARNLNCRVVTVSSIRAFERGLAACFGRADELNLDVSVVPHLDEGVKTHAAWRNALVFDPLIKCVCLKRSSRHVAWRVVKGQKPRNWRWRLHSWVA